MNVRKCRPSMLLVVLSLLAPSLVAAQPACQPGRFASAQSGTCDECNPGTYQPAIGQDSCFLCEAGRFTDVPARTACDQCGPGRFQDMPGRTTCFDCSAGSFRDATG